MRTVPGAPGGAGWARTPPKPLWKNRNPLFWGAFPGPAPLPAGGGKKIEEGLLGLKKKEEKKKRGFDSGGGPRGKKMGGQWTCVTHKSRASRSRGALRLPPETYGILRI